MDISGDDLDINLSRKIPKKGRRAGLSYTPQTDNETAISTIDGSVDSPRSNEGFLPPSKTKNDGGWAEGTIGQPRVVSSKNIAEQERTRDIRNDESDSEIPVIPDLDDLEDDILSLSINDIDNIHSKTTAYRELNTDVIQQGVYDMVSCLDGVDLSVLIRFLQEENDIIESDEPWTWDSLFTEVTSSLHQTYESGEEFLP
ncbi:intraflagellar transport protein 43 homolog A-like [Ctenocephalides felis]|uniref:intraflagellar transport protein 43 homolog A-like n=1 Tax=Ctenocephalides felis TaxID=7515 RepID=UPI000E6E4411|nr:intraflagellar transport protein 43 homolog A-like [Ctenocephalides felis]